MHYKPDYREAATKRVIDELLDTWQPLAAIALRSKITERLAMSIFYELEEKGKIEIKKGSIDRHNKVVFARNKNFVRVLGLRMQLKNQGNVIND